MKKLSDNFQAAAGGQGRAFEDAVETLLLIEGWTIDERHAVVAGVEVDLVAVDLAGVRWWIECKGSWLGRTPGSKRGDTVKKAVGVAWYLSRQPDACPYMLVTSHLPSSPTGVPGRMLDEARSTGLFARIRVVGIGDDPHQDMP